MRKLISKLKNRIIELAIGFATLIAGLVLYLYLSQFSGDWSTKQDVWGQFGDFVGGTLNPMLGFISVLVLAATLNLQRKELAEARKAALENNNILAEQLKVMHIQSLENTFFKMVDEYKKDAIVTNAQTSEAQNGILKAVYSLAEGRAEFWSTQDHRKKNAYFSQMTNKATNYGEVRHVILEKVVSLIEIAEHLNNNQVHYGLLQTVVGPRILSAIIHLAYHEAPAKYATLTKAKRLLQNINVALVFDEQIAKDFWDGDQLNKYYEQQDEILTSFRKSELAPEMVSPS